MVAETGPGLHHRYRLVEDVPLDRFA